MLNCSFLCPSLLASLSWQLHSPEDNAEAGANFTTEMLGICDEQLSQKCGQAASMTTLQRLFTTNTMPRALRLHDHKIQKPSKLAGSFPSCA